MPSTWRRLLAISVSPARLSPARKRRAELLLNLAGIDVIWGTAPTADEIKKLDQERMLHDALFTEETTADDLILARALLAEQASINRDLDALRNGVARPTFVNVAPMVAVSLLPRILTAMAQEHPEYPVSVNGKMRGKITFPVNKPKDEIEKEVLVSEIIQKYLEGKPVKKVIVVPNKIVNVVV